MALFSISRRSRVTPFHQRVMEHGVKAFTFYNHMLLPSLFTTLEGDYHHLKKDVQVWDVACERQVEITGKDAAFLTQYLVPRNLANMKVGQCYYTALTDHNGGMLNDPMILKLAEDHFWISVADSDILLWAKGIALGMKLDVTITEPDISPLAIQGPKSDELAARVFGDNIRDLRFFNFAKFPFMGREIYISRSGYSKQGGFEIYLDRFSDGNALWDAIFKVGKDLNVQAGCPQMIERIEAGLLSYGNDLTILNNPFEAGLGKYCHEDQIPDFIGKAALTKIRKEGHKREIRYLAVDGAPLFFKGTPWKVMKGDQFVGEIGSITYSPDFKTNVAMAMIEREFWQEGTQAQVHSDDGIRNAIIHEKSFI